MVINTVSVGNILATKYVLTNNKKLDLFGELRSQTIPPDIINGKEKDRQNIIVALCAFVILFDKKKSKLV